MTTTGDASYFLLKNIKDYKRCHSSSYYGQQEKSIRHGFGVYTYTNGFFQYEGEWIDGKKHGFGKFSMKDGSYFKGEFKNGEIDGNGLRYFGLTGNTYTGTLCKGELHGQGIMEYKNGSVYEGSWEYNKRQGQGVLKEKGGSVYDGTFFDHKKHGVGVQTYQNGDMYRGNWIQGYRQGHGYLETSDGTYYKGQWANDVMSGQGYMQHSSGMVYEGNWINGVPQALATKLVFVPNPEVHYIEKEKSFKIEIQCYNDDKQLIPEQGRTIQIIAGMQPEAVQNTSSPEGNDNAKDLENLITTPYGYSVFPCPLNMMALEQTPSNENTEDKEAENSDPVVTDPTMSELPPSMSEEMMIQKTTDGKVIWENLLAPTSCVIKKIIIPQETSKKKPSKNVGTGQKPKKENLVTEIDEKSNEFVLIAKDITEPPFMNQRLQTAFMKIKLYQPKKFARWQSARIISRLSRLKSSAMDKKQPTL